MIGDTSGNIQVYDQSNIDLYQVDIDIVNRIIQLPNDYVVSVSNDCTVNVFTGLNWTIIQTYTGHSDWVTDVEYINTDTLASSSFDGTIQVWSISSSLTSRTVVVNQVVNSIQLLSNGYYLAGGLHLGKINIYNLNTGGLITTLVGHTNQVNDLVLISNSVMASSSSDKTIRIWNLSTNKIKFILTGHTSAVNGLKVVTSDILASGSWDKTVKLWNTTSGSLIRTLVNHTNGILYSIDLYDRQTLITGSWDQTIKYWNFITGQLLNTIYTDLIINSLAVVYQMNRK